MNTLSEALAQLREAGLEADGSVGNADPILAVTDAWDPKKYDEIILSTLPMRFSKWLHAGLPERISKLTDAPVTHVVSQPPKPELEVAPPPAHHDPGMGPLSVLSLGRSQAELRRRKQRAGIAAVRRAARPAIIARWL